MSFNQNNLSLLNFKFKLDITPELEYRVQKVSLPGMTLGTVDVATPFVKIPLSGNITYDTFDVTFMVGESMKEYLEIFNWMTKLGYPDRLGQYQNIVSDCSLIILNSSSRANINVRFTDAFPVGISNIEMDSTLQEVQYATATAKFRFLRWYIEPYNA